MRHEGEWERFARAREDGGGGFRGEKTEREMAVRWASKALPHVGRGYSEGAYSILNVSDPDADDHASIMTSARHPR